MSLGPVFVNPVTYIHGQVFSCITGVLTNHSSWSSALLQHQKCTTFLKALFPMSTCNKHNYRNQKIKHAYIQSWG